MSGGGFRLGSGGLIDRSRPLSFTFDGRSYQGCAGDTLASALLANGVRVVGRSFKYHRPRGVLSAGHEEPNALVELRSGARREPNVKATTIELYDGLVASSQNRWPSLGFDVMALNGLLKPVFAAGFYYKTFMWPASFWEKIYEPVIRRAAGLGRASALEDPDSYEHSNAHCDLLVAGGGGAGLMAALTAGRSGAKVILCEDQPRLGGRLLDERESVGGQPAAQWVNSVAAELAAMPNVRVFSRASVVAAFDGGVFAALERVADHLPEPPPFTPRQRFWRIAARRAIIATGASERPLAFPDNDRPGIMLAGAVRSYLNRFGVAAGRQIAVYTATDDGWLTARDLIKAGLPPVVVIDAREKAPAEFADVAKAVPVVLNGPSSPRKGAKASAPLRSKDRRRAKLRRRRARRLGRLQPSIQLASCFRGRPAWSDKIQAFLAPGVDGLHMAGAAAGVFAPGEALKSGADAGSAALQALGLPVKPVELPAIRHSAAGSAPARWWRPGRAGTPWCSSISSTTSPPPTSSSPIAKAIARSNI
ncbi:Sarcosine oxidase subunit alpha (fragment) [Methylocella tundrae]|uniref:Sarcosine oxidase subunit alpha n=1 Tax=Methylocella tundrae TaxID=227605 RepID=A0A4U8Z3I6_METTU